jgi:hypothetical protein
VATTVKCPQCGAKNTTEVPVCRICALSMPNAAAIRQRGAGGDGVVFAETVEREREAWRDYSAGRMSVESRSRRPADLPDLPPKAWSDPAAHFAELDGARTRATKSNPLSRLLRRRAK